MNTKKSLLQSADFWISILILAFCGVTIWQITLIDIPESRLLPIMVLVIMLVSGVALLFESIRHKESGAPVKNLLFTKKEILAVVILCAFYMLINVLGFYSALFLMSTGISLLIWNCKSKKDLVKLLIYNVVLTIVLYVSFSILFGMVMPSGIFL